MAKVNYDEIVVFNWELRAVGYDRKPVTIETEQSWMKLSGG